MYDVLTGKQRALVFPVMCNGFVKIDYSDNVPDSADDIGYGVWSTRNFHSIYPIYSRILGKLSKKLKKD